MASGITQATLSDEKMRQAQSAYNPYPTPGYSAPAYHTVADPDQAIVMQPNLGPKDVEPNSVKFSNEDSSEAATKQQKTEVSELLRSDNVFKLTRPVEITFTDVFLEPRGSEIPETIYNLHRTLFTWTERGVYTCFGTVFGTILCIVWGILFGAGCFFVTWLAQPLLKWAFMFIRVLTNAAGSIIRGCFDPVFRSCSLALSGIKGAFQLNVTGLGFLQGTMAKRRRGLSHSDSRSMMLE